MILHRIATSAYARDLSGTGAMLHGGRWNAQGIRMLYTSQSLSLAALEIIANLSSSKFNIGLQAVQVELPDHLEVTKIPELPNDWDVYPHSYLTVEIGTKFIQSGGLCLQVPSAIIKSECNYLLNPLHPDFAMVKVLDVRPLMLDQRVLK